ncbi:MAG TPA: glutamyl-tRNA reductase [Mycobacteriales bacterium]|jgi:glutamyl-tRNA reductase|nr:glutamyl-tRNA reductase [Mycobacteriales bacterium]
MSLLVIGLSDRTTPISVLERAVIGADDLPKVLHELSDCEHVNEALVLSTCNRIEAYVEVEKFHGGVFEVSSALARQAGMDVADFGDYLYVHYEQAACHHLFRVAAGLDSMVVGEAQILGQLRSAYALAVEQQTVGRALHDLVQRALSAGKRVHAETTIDRAGATVVGQAVALATATVGPLTDRRALIVGAGSMGALGGATLGRAGALPPVVANRSADNGARLAEKLGGRAVGLDQLTEEIAVADIVLTSTGSTSVVVTADAVRRAMAARPDRPLVILDLALPRDVDPAAATIEGVTYLDLEAVRDAPGGADAAAVAEAERMLSVDVDSYLAAQRAVAVAPTVAALRARASDVVDAELLRLDAKLPGLDPRVRAELARTVRRTVSTLLHGPTVRVKQLASSPGGSVYADALRTLFELGPQAVDALTGAAVVEDPTGSCVFPAAGGGPSEEGG